jgi:hypothetical protein
MILKDQQTTNIYRQSHAPFSYDKLILNHSCTAFSIKVYKQIFNFMPNLVNKTLIYGHAVLRYKGVINFVETTRIYLTV